MCRIQTSIMSDESFLTTVKILICVYWQNFLSLLVDIERLRFKTPAKIISFPKGREKRENFLAGCSNCLRNKRIRIVRVPLCFVFTRQRMTCMEKKKFPAFAWLEPESFSTSSWLLSLHVLYVLISNYIHTWVPLWIWHKLLLCSCVATLKFMKSQLRKYFHHILAPFWARCEFSDFLLKAIGKGKMKFSFFRQRHALSTSFDIFCGDLHRVTNFFAKTGWHAIIFCGRKNPEFPFFEFPYFRVLLLLKQCRLSIGPTSIVLPHVLKSGPSWQARIQDFGQGATGVLTPVGAPSPKFAQNRGFSLKTAWKLHDFNSILGARGSLDPLPSRYISCE